MPTLASLATERGFLRLVQKGRIKVTKAGNIYNCKTGKKIGNNKSGWYSEVSWRNKKGHRYYMRAHRLVWIAFNGLITDPTLQINHIDGDKDNNALDNLELVTAQENVTHAFKTGLVGRAIGEDNGLSKLKNTDIRKIKWNFLQGRRIKQIAKHYGMAHESIRLILHKRIYAFIDTPYDDACIKKLAGDKLTAQQGEKNGASKFMHREVIEIRRQFAQKEKDTGRLADIYGVDRETIRGLLNGKTYAKVKSPYDAACKKRLKGAKDGRKLTPNQVKEIRYYFLKGSSAKALSVDYSITIASIYNVVNGKTYSTVRTPYDSF